MSDRHGKFAVATSRMMDYTPAVPQYPGGSQDIQFSDRCSTSELGWLSLPAPGAELSPGVLAGISKIASAIAGVAGEVLKVGAAVDVTTGSPTKFEPAFCVRGCVRELDCEFEIALDIAAAQAVLSPLMHDYAPVGLQSLTEVQTGLLEYATLAIGRRLLSTCPGVVIESMGKPALAANDRLTDLYLQVRAGLHRGMARLRFDPSRTFFLLDPAEPDPGTLTRLWVALPSFQLSDAESIAMASGDLLVLPLSDTSGSECTLLAGDGWEIGRAVLRELSSGRAALSVSALGVRPAERDRARVTVADGEHSIGFIADLRVGASLDVAADRTILWLPGDRLWGGELVFVGSELALRLTQKLEKR